MSNRPLTPISHSVISSFVMTMLLSIVPCKVLGQATRPFDEMTSAEMKAMMESKDYLKGLSGYEREIVEGGTMAIYQSKVLAEQYFAAIGDARSRLAGAKNASVARNVAYSIVRTLKLDPDLGPGSGPLPEESEQRAWFKERMLGTYHGIFLVKPSDGKPLEQYRMVFAVVKGKRTIEKVEKDPTFDATAYARDIEKAKIIAWAEATFKGKRANVLSHLPAGDYTYLNAPTFDSARIEEPVAPSSQPTTTQTTAVSAWKGTISLFFKPERSEFEIVERLKVEIEKKGDVIAIVKCDRDVEFARLMEDKVKAAGLILKYISQPDQRTALLIKGGKDDLPESAKTLFGGKESLALGLIEKKRLRGDPTYAPGDPGKGIILEGICAVKEEKEDARPLQYLFDVVGTTDKDNPFMMLRVASARH